MWRRGPGIEPYAKGLRRRLEAKSDWCRQVVFRQWIYQEVSPRPGLYAYREAVSTRGDLEPQDGAKSQNVGGRALSVKGDEGQGQPWWLRGISGDFHNILRESDKGMAQMRQVREAYSDLPRNPRN